MGHNPQHRHDLITQEKKAYLREIHEPEAEWPTDVKSVYEKLRERLFELGVEIGDVMEDAGYANNNVSTKFKHFVGRGPKAWMIRHRVELAQRLLDYEAVSVTDVAFAVGYENPSAFTKAFKSRVGVLPSRF